MNKMDLPIGVIDSGKGGLGVINYLSFSLKNENFILYFDSKNFPYGNKSKTEIVEIGKTALDHLKDKSKVIIIGCNTLSCNLYEIDKKIYKINECIKEELIKINNKKVLILCTSLTEKSNYFQNICLEYDIDFVIKACPYLVTMVEKNELSFEKVREYLKPLMNINYDVIVLGCTHFYYLEEFIKKIFPRVKIITGYKTLAKKIDKDLRKNKLRNIHKIGSTISIIRT